MYLYCVDGVVIAAQCTANFLISIELPEFRWICRLNFAQMPIFQAWGSLASLKSQTRDPQLKVPPRGSVLRIFMSWKNPSTSARFESENLGFRGEHVTPRPPRQIWMWVTGHQSGMIFIKQKKQRFLGDKVRLEGRNYVKWHFPGIILN